VIGLVAIAVALAVEAARRFRNLSIRDRASYVRSLVEGEGPDAAADFRTAPAGWRRTVRAAAPLASGAAAALILGRFTGPIGWPVGAVAGWALPVAWRRRKAQHVALKLEGQLAELVESASLAVRTGLSITHALEFAAGEAESPIRDVIERVFIEQRLGLPFERGLDRLAETIGTDDARLFVLVVGVHAKSGGDLAGALDEVGSTIRHRVAVRRELRALSAQGRISGGVLGALPLLFFLVLAGTSRRELEPIYRSAPGMAMIGGGLAMQGIAYLWIRKMLRVEV